MSPIHSSKPVVNICLTFGSVFSLSSSFAYLSPSPVAAVKLPRFKISEAALEFGGEQNPEGQNQNMEWVAETVESIKSFQIRKTLNDAVSLGVIISSALIIWKALMCITGSESPVVVVLTGSMEPGFKRGDILFLHMNNDPIRAGEIIVYNVDGRSIPIVHRVIKVHERKDTGEVNILTKGDANPGDDIGLYAPGQRWLEQRHIMGRAVGFLPYVGWVTIIMTEKPIVKYVLIGVLGLLVVTSKD